MTIDLQQSHETNVFYPETDGEPLADDTLQYEWIVKIKGGLGVWFSNDPNVFVAADLFWYPVKGDPTTRHAPDTMVAFGRPKGHRGSYRQWEEDDIAPQVVFEVQSSKDTSQVMQKKFAFYDVHGVEEYYLYDPHTNALHGWQRSAGRLKPIAQMDGWRSPRLGIRFVLEDDTLHIYRPDGQRFLTYDEQDEQRKAAIAAWKKLQEAAQERALRLKMEALLRKHGIDLDEA
jgi:Uma2 family endonuclease